MVLKKAGKGSLTLVIAAAAFLAGMVAWAALSGIIGGVLDSVGVVIAGSTYLMVSPLFGLVAAGYAVQEVSG